MRLGKKEEADKRILYGKAIPKKNFSGKTPNLLVGEYGYPNVNVGALSTEEDIKTDNPKDFARQNTQIDEILTKRQEMINSRVQRSIKNVKEKFVEQTQEIAKSSKAVDSEIELEKAIPTYMSFDERNIPHGPSAQLKKLEITSNPKIPKKIERITSDTDVKATTALQELQGDYDEYYLTQLLSAGTLGQKRKLVPTKWSITAVDDTLGKNLHEKILDNPESDYEYLTGGYLGNYFILLIMPGPWSFELIEVVQPGTIYNKGTEVLIGQDYEYTQGRKKYATNTAGGYYATRLPILEHFIKNKRQGRVLAIRIITKEYTIPLGVWVVREATRKALEKINKEHDKPESQKELLKLTKERMVKLGVKNPDEIINISKLLKEQQRGLNSWI